MTHDYWLLTSSAFCLSLFIHIPLYDISLLLCSFQPISFTEYEHDQKPGSPVLFGHAHIYSVLTLNHPITNKF